MSDAHSSEDIDRHVRRYLLVFGALMLLTIVTVAIYYLHLPVVPAIVLALCIASIKAGLVASVFMHLIDEKKAIYWLLGLTVAFFIALMLLPILTSGWNQVQS